MVKIMKKILLTFLLTIVCSLAFSSGVKTTMPGNGIKSSDEKIVEDPNQTKFITPSKSFNLDTPTQGVGTLDKIFNYTPWYKSPRFSKGLFGILFLFIMYRVGKFFRRHDKRIEELNE